MTAVTNERLLREMSMAACAKGASLAEGHLPTPALNRQLTLLDLELLVGLLEGSGFYHLGFGIDGPEDGREFIGFGTGQHIPSSYEDILEPHHWSSRHLDPLMLELCERIVLWNETMMGVRLPYRRCGKREDQTWTISCDDLAKLAARLSAKEHPIQGSQPALFPASKRAAR